jgi:hypothetical protein
MDVPAIAWNSSPVTEPASGNGELPARIWMPGAVMSGLMTSPPKLPGPCDENWVIDGAISHVEIARVSRISAVAPAPADAM